MDLKDYSPTFRWVLMDKVKAEKKIGNIYVPGNLDETTAVDELRWKVAQVGPDCTTIKPGDVVLLSRGIYPEPIGDSFQVMEMQIKGRWRKK